MLLLSLLYHCDFQYISNAIQTKLIQFLTLLSLSFTRVDNKFEVIYNLKQQISGDLWFILTI